MTIALTFFSISIVADTLMMPRNYKTTLEHHSDIITYSFPLCCIPAQYCSSLCMANKIVCTVDLHHFLYRYSLPYNNCHSVLSRLFSICDCLSRRIRSKGDNLHWNMNQDLHEFSTILWNYSEWTDEMFSFMTKNWTIDVRQLHIYLVVHHPIFHSVGT